jgi:hypothetical protein
MPSSTRVYDKHNNYCCTVTKHHLGYDIVFPPDETLKSVSKITHTEVHQWLDAYFGDGEWALK